MTSEPVPVAVRVVVATEHFTATAAVESVHMQVAPLGTVAVPDPVFSVIDPTAVAAKSVLQVPGVPATEAFHANAVPAADGAVLNTMSPRAQSPLPGAAAAA
jgi:hypothetical protein